MRVKKHKCYSFKESKINLRDNCFYDLIPEKFLLEYCFIKNEITNQVIFTNVQKTNEALLEKGFEPRINPRSCNLFYLDTSITSN